RLPEIHHVAVLEVAPEEHLLEQRLGLALGRRHSTEEVAEGSLGRRVTHGTNESKRQTQTEGDSEPHSCPSGGFAAYLPSSARLRASTFTRGSPRKPRERPSVCRSTSCRTTAGSSVRTRATRETW